MTTNLILGLHGLPGTGKDSIAEILVSTHGFRRVAFADALKRELCKAFNVSREWFDSRDFKEMPVPRLALDCCANDEFISWYLGSPAGLAEVRQLGEYVFLLPRSPRWLMQTWGTDWRKAADPNYWVDKALAKITEAVAHKCNVVVTDVRFFDEADALDRYWVRNYLCEVLRPGTEGNGHVSNQRLPSEKFDLVISNDGDLDVLRLRVLQAMRKIL